MAVPKRKKTRSKKGMINSKKKKLIKTFSRNKISNELHFRHHLTKKGFYKECKIIIKKK